MRALNPDQLRSFAQVIELGGFSAAAERLHLTQPAVSQQVRQLERRFSLKLIERVGRNVAPTVAGLELLAHARRIEAVIASATEAMARHATGRLGRVRIGTGATACIHLLPPVLRDLRERLPSLEIAVATGNTAHILKLLEDNALDVGLVTLPVRGRALSITPVLDDEFVAIASPEAPPLPRRVTPAVLVTRPLVLYEPGAQTRRIVDQWCGRKRSSIKPVMELGSVEAIKELVGAGLGYYGILPRMAVSNERKRGSLVVNSLTPRLSRKLALVLRRDKRLDRGLREVVNALTRLGTRS
ncbi:MAG: LysR family transcriptional regulator [Hyphomicrobiales bacterium]|nr:LysR family transcriptional regulator [Hyphomicrobiales bacterium]MBV9516788.1 LysR family transcriptional regulator [Hyphomicrobiales bacterium]